MFGSQLLKKRGVSLDGLDLVQVAPDCLRRVPFVVLYFSAFWCPPAKGYIQHLVKFHEQANLFDLRKAYSDAEQDTEMFDIDFPGYVHTARSISQQADSPHATQQFANVEVVFISMDSNRFQY